MSGPIRLAEICEATGVESETLRKWIARDHVALELRNAGGWQEFSLSDAVVIGLIAAFVRAGFSVGHAAEIAQDHRAAFFEPSFWIRLKPDGLEWEGTNQRAEAQRWLSNPASALITIVDVALLRKEVFSRLKEIAKRNSV